MSPSHSPPIIQQAFTVEADIIESSRFFNEPLINEKESPSTRYV